MTIKKAVILVSVVGALAGAAFLAPAISSAASAITNGSFETGTAPGSYLELFAGNATDITGWTVDSGSVDYIGSYWQSSDGSRNVDLNGTTTGAVSQTFATDIGATYTVTFDLSGNPDSRSDVQDPFYSPSLKDVQVNATGGSPQDYTFDTASMGNSLGNMMWQPKTYTFTATAANTTLSFASQIPGAFGPAIDNVDVEETTPPPPPPAVCPEGTVQSASPVDTISVNAAQDTSTAGATSLANGQSYILVASGTWQNSLNLADAEYTTTDNWTTHMDGYDINPYFLGASEFDLEVNGAFVNWGAYSPAHQYSYLYTGTGAPVNFLVFDGDSNGGPANITPGWYGDNSGGLSVNVYACVPPTPPTNACATPNVAPAGWTLISGTSGADNVTLLDHQMFSSGAGNDHVIAGNGDHIVCLGSGNDHVTVGNGNNVIFTGSGNDQVETGDGIQFVNTGSGNDKITTGSGNDTIDAGSGNNNVSSGAGDDTITAGSGNDHVDAGLGTDTCLLGTGVNVKISCELP